MHAALKGRPCQPRDVDQRVRIAETDLSTYPDLSVVCGRRVPAEDDPHSLTNPTVLFEVLSKSTAGPRVASSSEKRLTPAWGAENASIRVLECSSELHAL